MAETDLEQRIAAVRRFNRFYTSQIGVLHEGYLESPFSLTEVRVLYELAHVEQATASALSRDLALDPSYLSRILRGFESRGLIVKEPSPADGRQNILRLTDRGMEAFAPLNNRSRDDIAAMLNGLPEAKQRRLVESMHIIQALLDDDQSVPRVPYLLRPHRPGDMGWIVHRHGVLYAQEYGWDEQFEALVASIVAEFIQNEDPKRERCWIAERDGEIVGSVFLVKESGTVAKLRLLLVEPTARGLGIGSRLVAECVEFARLAGYRKITLWTIGVLHAARHIYEGAQFRLVHQEPQYRFGDNIIGETWEREL